MNRNLLKLEDILNMYYQLLVKTNRNNLFKDYKDFETSLGKKLSSSIYRKDLSEIEELFKNREEKSLEEFKNLLKLG